jgi:hypothetical protein
VSTTQIDGSRQIKSATITTTQLSASAGITDGQLATPYVKADGTRAFTAAQSMGGFKLTNIADGTTSTDAASYGQMVALLNGRDDKASVRVATTGAETYTIAGGAVTQISGTSVNGVSPAVGEDIRCRRSRLWCFGVLERGERHLHRLQRHHEPHRRTTGGLRFVC